MRNLIKCALTGAFIFSAVLAVPDLAFAKGHEKCTAQIKKLIERNQQVSSSSIQLRIKGYIEDAKKALKERKMKTCYITINKSYKTLEISGN